MPPMWYWLIRIAVPAELLPILFSMTSGIPIQQILPVQARWSMCGTVDYDTKIAVYVAGATCLPGRRRPADLQ